MQEVHADALSSAHVTRFGWTTMGMVWDATWTCDHIYVLTGSVCNTILLTVELFRGTWCERACPSSVPANNEVGLVRSVSYSSYPGFVVARGGTLMAQAIPRVPFSFRFWATPWMAASGLTSKANGEV